jgi:hypothetical protein
LREFQPVEQVFVGLDFAFGFLSDDPHRQSQAFGPAGDSNHQREAVNFG